MNRRQLITILTIVTAWRFMQDARYAPSLALAALQFALVVGVFVVALTLHEVGHAVVATWLGDPTPRNAGRLTLNPLAHLNPIGTLLIFAAHFGFATPVPIDPRYFRKPERDQVLVAFAGPGMNLLLSGLSIAVARAIYGGISGWQAGEPAIWTQIAFWLAWKMAEMNALLAIFNLFPIPPLDGSYLAERVLPPAWRFWYRQNQMRIAMIAMVLLMVGVFQPIFNWLALEVRQLCLT